MMKRIIDQLPPCRPLPGGPARTLGVTLTGNQTLTSVLMGQCSTTSHRGLAGFVYDSEVLVTRSVLQTHLLQDPSLPTAGRRRNEHEGTGPLHVAAQKGARASGSHYTTALHLPCPCARRPPSCQPSGKAQNRPGFVRSLTSACSPRRLSASPFLSDPLFLSGSSHRESTLQRGGGRGSVRAQSQAPGPAARRAAGGREREPGGAGGSRGEPGGAGGSREEPGACPRQKVLPDSLREEPQRWVRGRGLTTGH